MITKKLLKHYKRYKGDIDAWSRSNVTKEHYQDWYLIGSLIQDLKMIDKLLASQEYIISIEGKMLANCENDEAIQELYALEKSLDS